MTSRYDLWRTAAPEEEPDKVYIQVDDKVFTVKTNLLYEVVKVVFLDFDKPEERVILSVPLLKPNGLEPLYNIFLYKEEGKYRVEADSIDELEVYLGDEHCAELVTVTLADEELQASCV